jgi:hypothetical protein
MPTMGLARPIPTPMPMPLPTPTPISIMPLSDSNSGPWLPFRRESSVSGGFLNRTSDAVLGGIAKIGDWADRNIPQDDVLDFSLSVPGAIASSQEGLGQTTQMLDRTESVASQVDEFTPSRFVRAVAKAGAIVDAGTGILDVARAVKQDRDVGDHLYTRTFKASVVSSTSVSLGAIAGIGAATLVGGTVGAPVIVGGLVAAGVSYGVKKLLSFF